MLAVAMAATSLAGQEPRGLDFFSLAHPRSGPWRLIRPGSPPEPPSTVGFDVREARLRAVGFREEWPGDAVFHQSLAGAGLNVALSNWALIDPDGRARASGSGDPDADALETALRKGAGALPWEDLERLLKSQPDHGEARLAAAEMAFALIPGTVGKGPQAWTTKFRLEAEARQALDHFLSVPGWPDQADLGALAPEGLGARLLQHRTALREQPARMAEEGLAALAEDPGSLRLQFNLAFLHRLLFRDPADRLAGKIEAIDPLPGQAWPPLPLLSAIAESLCEPTRWWELLDRAPTWYRSADRLFITREGWDRHLLREGTIKAYEAMARSWREGWEILPVALDELRGMSGGHYRSLAAFLLRRARLPDFPPDDDRRRIFELAARAPLAPPPMPPPLPRWELEIQDPARRADLAQAFDEDPALLPWLRTEVKLGGRPAPPGAWSLRLGTVQSPAGGDRPSLGALAPTLREGRPGRLWVASEAVGAAPDALGRRRFRIPILLERMPCRAIEPLLAEDLRRALLTPALSPEELSQDLWFVEAQKAIPELEAHLRRWPLDGERWRALAFWTTCVPTHRGPAALAETLPGLHPGHTLLQDLPSSVHARVGEELKRQRAWTALSAWFSPVWEGLRNGEGAALRPRKQVQELVPIVRAGLDAAFEATARPGDRRALREAGRELLAPRSEAER